MLTRPDTTHQQTPSPTQTERTPHNQQAALRQREGVPSPLPLSGLRGCLLRAT